MEEVQIVKKEKAEIVESEEEDDIEEKSFLQRVADLINAFKRLEEFKNDDGLESFMKVVLTTDKKEGVQRANLEDKIKQLFTNFYNIHSKSLKEENFDFLLDSQNSVSIIFGKSGKANIKISEIYTLLSESYPDLIDTVDGNMYFVLQHVCPESDLDDILTICDKFDQSPTESGGGNFIDLIGNIIGRVSEKFDGQENESLEDENGKLNPHKIGTLVTDLFGDDQIQGGMKNMMTNLTSDDFDINSVFQNLMKMNSNN